MRRTQKEQERNIHSCPALPTQNPQSCFMVVFSATCPGTNISMYGSSFASVAGFKVELSLEKKQPQLQAGCQIANCNTFGFTTFSKYSLKTAKYLLESDTDIFRVNSKKLTVQSQIFIMHPAKLMNEFNYYISFCFRYLPFWLEMLCL